VRADRGIHGTVNLGTGTAHRLTTIAHAVAAAFAQPARFAVEPADPADVPDTLADPRRCHHLLGLVPRTDLDALVRRQVAATLADCSPTVAASLADDHLVRCFPQTIGRDPRGTANAPATEDPNRLNSTPPIQQFGARSRGRR
jgi:hypothetical protein